MFGDNNAPGGFFLPTDQNNAQHQQQQYAPNPWPTGGQMGQMGQIGQMQNPNMMGQMGQMGSMGSMAQPPQMPMGGMFNVPSGGAGAYDGQNQNNTGVGYSGGGVYQNQNSGYNNAFNNNNQSGHNQPGQINYQQSNQDGNGERRKAKVFTPVTVKMVSNSQPRPDDVCEYDGDPINDIILCGRILRRIEEPMRTQFEINDNTGTFYVLFYHKGENQVPTALRNFEYQQFTYVKVYGNIRVFKEEKAIVGTHIKRLQKFDELTNHFLSVYVSHCIRKKGILKPRELAMVSSAANQENNNSSTSSKAGLNMGSSTNNSGNRSNENSGNAMNLAAQGPKTGVVGDQVMAFDIRKSILEVMKQLTKTQKFVNKQHLFGLLQDRVDQSKFDTEMEQMMNDGEICTAFDQNHYCLTS